MGTPPKVCGECGASIYFNGESWKHAAAGLDGMHPAEEMTPESYLAKMKSEDIRMQPQMDMATAHKTVTDILMRNFMPKDFQGKEDEPHIILIRRGVATVTDEIMAIVEQLYRPEDR